MKKVFAAGIALAVLFGGNIAATHADTVAPTAITQQADFAYSEQALIGLKYINELRTKMGLQTVKLNPYLTKAAENHSNYLETNVLTGHTETVGGKGFTGVRPRDRVISLGGDDPNSSQSQLSSCLKLCRLKEAPKM
jgi:uncharacterized protein YkwD